MEPSDKYIKEFQEIYKKKHGKELPRKEAMEEARSLLGFVQIIYDSCKEDCIRKHKLKDHPKGFHLDDEKTYSCLICRENISNEQTWWDESGIKCLHCQKALDKKIIPKSVCKDTKSWYSKREFDYYFKIKSPTIRKFIRQEKLKPRVIKNIATGKTHFELFLIKDNKDVLPNKPESYLVKDDQDMVHVEYKEVNTSKLIKEDDKKKHLKITTDLK